MIDRTEIEKALRVFVKGFAEVRGRTWPYLQTRTGDLWRLHDAPRKTSRGYRREEWIGRNIDIRSADAAIRAGVISHFAVCSLLTESDSVESMKSGFRDMGYRQTGSEPLFVHRLKRVPRVTCPAEIRIMKTEADAALFAAATRTRQVDASVLRDAPYRQYLAFVGDELVGRVRSINTPEGQVVLRHVCRAPLQAPADRKGTACADAS
ncbi:MAG: hypothetical protein R2832_16660 [Rhodothermales bacterium]